MTTFEHHISRIIKETLSIMGAKYSSRYAHDLIFRTGRAESGYRALEGGVGPELGFFQIHPRTAKDVLENFISKRKHLMNALSQIGVKLGADLGFILRSNIAAQVMFCRIVYWRVPEPIPGDINEQAIYWKQYYNTERGLGTIEHFLESNHG